MALFRFQRRYARRTCLIMVIGLILVACQSKAPIVTPDTPLFKRVWMSETEPEAVILALHGFNDHTRTFAFFAEEATKQNIAVIAYDHPGFGRNEDAGYWAGTDRLVDAATHMADETRTAYPDLPVYMLGVSMGGAITILANQRHDLPVDGLILSAPAVWGGRAFNPIYRWASRLIAWLFPDFQVSPSGLKIFPSDNKDMLRALAKDPYVIKKSRSETVDGLVTLMDTAFATGPDLKGDVLLLAGAKDEVVPPDATDAFLEQVKTPDCTFVRYADGWHMLLRDLQRDVVFDDIFSWINDRRITSADPSSC